MTRMAQITKLVQCRPCAGGCFNLFRSCRASFLWRWSGCGVGATSATTVSLGSGPPSTIWNPAAGASSTVEWPCGAGTRTDLRNTSRRSISRTRWTTTPRLEAIVSRKLTLCPLGPGSPTFPSATGSSTNPGNLSSASRTTVPLSPGPPMVGILYSQLIIPYWLPLFLTAIPFLIPLALRVRRTRRLRRRRKLGLCLACGYNLTGNVSGVCPECGTKILDAHNTPPPSSVKFYEAVPVKRAFSSRRLSCS